MRITKKWLSEKSACLDAVEWVLAQGISDPLELLRRAIAENHCDWANWGICRIFNRKQRIQYACFASRQILATYEKQYPGDLCPRQTIEVAERCILHNTKKNRAYAVNAAYSAAKAAYAVNAAYFAAYYAASAAYSAAKAAKDEKLEKILHYGISLLTNREEEKK